MKETKKTGGIELANSKQLGLNSQQQQQQPEGRRRRPLAEVQKTGSAGGDGEGKGKGQMVGRQQQLPAKKSGGGGLKPPTSGTESPGVNSNNNGTSKSALAKVKSGLISKKKQAGKVFVSKEIQTENGDISMVTGEEAPLQYWKDLAETRREALEAALEENYNLNQRLEDLEKEKALLEEMVEQAKTLAGMLQDLSDEENPDESGIVFSSNKEADDSVLDKDNENNE